MRTLRALSIRLGGLFHRGFREREMAAEFESHLQIHIDDNLRRGMSPEQARREARLTFGAMEAIKETYRETFGIPWIETLALDFRFGLRMLAKNPGSTTIAILALALGIGINTAIFSVLNAALLKFLPVRNPNELVMLTDPNASEVLGGRLIGERSLLAYTEFTELRDRATSLAGLCASQMLLQRWPIRVSDWSG